jgi:hypothetical protein
MQLHATVPLSLPPFEVKRILSPSFTKLVALHTQAGVPLIVQGITKLGVTPIASSATW